MKVAGRLPEGQPAKIVCLLLSWCIYLHVCLSVCLAVSLSVDSAGAAPPVHSPNATFTHTPCCVSHPAPSLASRHTLQMRTSGAVKVPTSVPCVPVPRPVRVRQLPWVAT